MGTEGGFRSFFVLRRPGRVKPNQVINGVMSGMDWFPTFVTATGYHGDSAADPRKGRKLAGTEYKVHLDGYDQTDMPTKGARSARNELWYPTESTLAAARAGDDKYTFVSQPDDWFGPRVHMDWAGIVNLRLDPFEKMGIGDSLFAKGWWAFGFWRFVFVQQEVGKLAQTALTFPRDAEGASFKPGGGEAEDREGDGEPGRQRTLRSSVRTGSTRSAAGPRSPGVCRVLVTRRARVGRYELARVSARAAMISRFRRICDDTDSRAGSSTLATAWPSRCFASVR